MTELAVWAVTVPADPAQLHFARHALRDWLAGTGVPEGTCEDAVWSADEAMSNAIANGGRSGARSAVLGVSAHVDDAVVVVTVVDEIGWRVPASGVVLAGRGMAIVRALAEEVNLAVTDGRTTFTAWFAREGATRDHSTVERRAD
ncbi:ATP-binding protein [Actinokineospora diospyrosa]|uniref:Anti-sigma regulatory factor (Ser/Thr protein kinase) n=1 Tax=Actinokineospora diospyrosa TaxID=103728 RepID=A0ABT1ILT0_9PSEU|nr:ATP-binding protein [Actinokineospora diospyrosa]MCP2273609.1 Anti-sigma regulatory factor (Ser/Thr protein kinase) [Actinokineospora diospyrosa]